MFESKLLRAIALIVLAATASAAHAAESWYTEYVRSVYPLGNGDFVITLVNSPAACTNGASPKYLHVQVGHNGVTADGVKALLATALTAFAAGKRLAVNFDDASNSCDVNRVYIID